MAWHAACSMHFLFACKTCICIFVGGGGGVGVLLKRASSTRSSLHQYLSNLLQQAVSTQTPLSLLSSLCLYLLEFSSLSLSHLISCHSLSQEQGMHRQQLAWRQHGMATAHLRPARLRLRQDQFIPGGLEADGRERDLPPSPPSQGQGRCAALPPCSVDGDDVMSHASVPILNITA